MFVQSSLPSSQCNAIQCNPIRENTRQPGCLNKLLAVLHQRRWPVHGACLGGDSLSAGCSPAEEQLNKGKKDGWPRFILRLYMDLRNADPQDNEALRDLVVSL